MSSFHFLHSARNQSIFHSTSWMNWIDLIAVASLRRLVLVHAASLPFTFHFVISFTIHVAVALAFINSINFIECELIECALFHSVLFSFAYTHFTVRHSSGWSPSSCTVSFHSKFSFHYTVASLRQWYISLNHRLHSHQISHNINLISTYVFFLSIDILTVIILIQLNSVQFISASWLNERWVNSL